MLKRYRCTRDCWWGLERYKRDHIYSLEPASKPPHHLQPLDGPAPARQRLPEVEAEEGRDVVYVCPVCGKELKSQRGLESHCAQVHPDPLVPDDGDAEQGFFGDPGE